MRVQDRFRITDHDLREIDRLLTKQEYELFKKLNRYHHPTTTHSIFVSRDSYRIARILLSREAEAIRIAALLHDIGKLDMFIIILDHGVSKSELMEMNEKLERHLVNPTLRDFTVGDVVKFRNEFLHRSSKRYISRFLRRHLKRRFGRQIKETLLDHIRNHQENTRKHLESINDTNSRDTREFVRIVDIAASHHAEYDNISDRAARLVGVVDKFQAMIQSEGKREQLPKENISTAINKLNDMFKGKSWEIEVIKKLHELYYDLEKSELILTISRFLEKYTSVSKAPSRIRKVALKISTRVVAFLKISSGKKLDQELQGLIEQFGLAFGR